MHEYVGLCTQCGKKIYDTEGFLNGVFLDNGDLICFECEYISRTSKDDQA